VEVEHAEHWQRPLPAPDAAAAPFWQAAARGELIFQQCRRCGHRQHYPRALCTACGGDPAWQTASGRGRIHTFTVIRQYGGKPFRDELPYVVAIVELDEGVRMMGNVTGCDVAQVQIGMAVEAYAIVAAEGVGVPFWRPAAIAADGGRRATQTR